MNHTRLPKLVLCAAGLLFLLGCTLPTPTPTPVPCQAADLVAPQITTTMGPPRNAIINTLRPTFEWLPTDYDCEIDGYLVSVTNAAGGGLSKYVDTGSTWAMDVDLEPASEYRWGVVAVALDGSYSPPSPTFTFFTGPACGESQRWAVSLESPAEGEVVTMPNPPLDWSYPDASCLPEDYVMTVQEQPAGTIALTGQGSPTSSFMTNIPYLSDCTLYHWWVQPVIGGVTSEGYIPSYFITDFGGTCPGEPCDPASLVAPTPVSPADGAAWTNSYPSVSWNYAYPACQRNLAFYIEIAVDPDFAGILVWGNTAGGWMTFDPAAAQLQDCTTYYWHVAASQEGLGPFSETWSFHTDFSGACGRSSHGTINQDAVCRGGPSLDYPVVLYLSRGAEVELTGRNEAGSWLVLTRPDGYGECWIGARLVTADDPAGLPVREAPPLVIATEEPTGEPAGPTPTPVNCNVLGCMACMANPACVWTQTTATCVGYCRNRP